MLHWGRSPVKCPASILGLAGSRQGYLALRSTRPAGILRMNGRHVSNDRRADSVANISRRCYCRPPMATKTCTVSFTGPSGARHSVEVSADSLYEAAIIGFNMLKNDGWVDPIAPGTRLEIQVRQPATTHGVSL